MTVRPDDTGKSETIDQSPVTERSKIDKRPLLSHSLILWQATYSFGEAASPPSHLLFRVHPPSSPSSPYRHLRLSGKLLVSLSLRLSI